MHLRFLLATAALLSATLFARADDYTIFQLNSSYESGGTIDGTLVLDTTSNTFTSANLTASGFNPSVEDASLTSIASQGTSSGEYSVGIEGFPSFLTLELPVTTLAGYAGSTICVLNVPNSGCTPPYVTVYNGDFAATSGTLELAPAVTPEPSSFVLLGTGLLGFAGVLRRRLA